MSQDQHRHNCEQNTFKDVEVRYEKINKEQWSRVLEQWHRPEHQSDKNDEIYAISYCNTLLISYCPFYGENLNEIESNNW